MKKVSPNQTKEIVCPWEKNLPVEEQTIFVISNLSAEQEAFLDDNLGYQGDVGYVLTLGKANLLALHMGLKEVKNLLGDDGENLTLKRDESKAKNGIPGVGRPWEMKGINEIAKRARDYVSTQIKEGAKLDEAEAKNS